MSLWQSVIKHAVRLGTWKKSLGDSSTVGAVIGRVKLVVIRTFERAHDYLLGYMFEQ